MIATPISDRTAKDEALLVLRAQTGDRAALGAHVSRIGQRVLRAVDLAGRP